MGLMKRGWGQAIFKGICVFLFAVAVGVDARGAEDARGKALSDGVANLVESFNASGVELYGKLASDKENAGKNIVVSPHSIGMAISMALTGARNATCAEMAKVLHQGLDREKMDKACGDLNDTLGKMKNKELDIAVANALCLTKFGDIVKDSYKELLKRDYRAELFDAKTVDPSEKSQKE